MLNFLYSCADGCENDGYNAFQRKCVEDDLFSVQLDVWSGHGKKMRKNLFTIVFQSEKY